MQSLDYTHSSQSYPHPDTRRSHHLEETPFHWNSWANQINQMTLLEILKNSTKAKAMQHQNQIPAQI